MRCSTRSAYRRRSRAAVKLQVNFRARTDAAAPIAAAPTGSSMQLRYGAGEALGLATLDEQSGDAVVDDVEQPADRAGHDGNAARRRFEGDEPEALAATRHDHDVGRAVVAGRAGGVAWARRRRPGRRLRARAARARVAASSAAPSTPLAPPTSTRMASPRCSPARARTATSGPFNGWIRPTNRMIGRSAGRPTAATCAAPISGGEEGVLDSRRHGLDHAMGIAVEPAELALLLGTADADRITAADHLGLGAVAPHRLEVAALGLDPGQGVERRDQRDVEAVLEAMAGDAAQPVVAVNHVYAASGFNVLGDAVGEHVDLLGERLFGQVERPGGDVHHRMSRLDHQLARQTRAIGPGVRRALDPSLGEGARRPRARTRSSLRCHLTLAARAGTCEERSGRPAARPSKHHRSAQHSRAGNALLDEALVDVEQRLLLFGIEGRVAGNRLSHAGGDVVVDIAE